VAEGDENTRSVLQILVILNLRSKWLTRNRCGQFDSQKECMPAQTSPVGWGFASKVIKVAHLERHRLVDGCQLRVRAIGTSHCIQLLERRWPAYWMGGLRRALCL
jgi:hypothetical protein